MIKGKLTFLGRVRSDEHKPLWTDVVEGHEILYPAVGSRFVMLVTSDDPALDQQVLKTSTITSVDGDTFTTKNSIYKWEQE